MSGYWDRDLALDLDTARDLGAAAVVTLLEPRELTLLRVKHLGEEVLRRNMRWFHLPIVDVSSDIDRFIYETPTDRKFSLRCMSPSMCLRPRGPDAGAKLLAHSHATTNPPSTTRSTPVTYAASSEIRNATAPATSDGVPKAPSGMRASKDCFAALAPPCPEAISSPRPSRALVSMKPGDMLLTRMPCGANVTAAMRLRPELPSLLHIQH